MNKKQQIMTHNKDKNESKLIKKLTEMLELSDEDIKQSLEQYFMYSIATGKIKQVKYKHGK